MMTIVTLSVPAAAQNAAPSAGTAERGIVVTGIPLETTRARLAACLARGCPPKEDIDATLALVENAFVAGEYKMARTALLESIRRNRQHAKDLPVDVSDLLRASGRVAAHLGEKTSYLAATRDAASILKDNLPENDPRILDARIEVGDSRARVDDIGMAVEIYRDVAKQARKRDLPVTEGYARLRVAGLYAAMASQNTAYRPLAEQELQDLIEDRDPRLSRFVMAARVLQARMAVKRGNMTAVDELIANAKLSGGKTPLLLYAPVIEVDTHARLARGNMNRVQMADVDDQWIDVGFWISADGKVSDVDILRQSQSVSGSWPKLVTNSIAGRKYSAFSPMSGQTGMQRVERYTMTAFWTTGGTSTHLRTRDPAPRLEMLDLTR
ncbi:hypothetical protein [Sphingomonas sp. GB1N7]|uniref:hypothetical protein n=1 Tax=Parasphingomonas caseinilytica TaxID=3096158 RepID=UPI002FC9204E